MAVTAPKTRGRGPLPIIKIIIEIITIYYLKLQ